MSSLVRFERKVQPEVILVLSIDYAIMEGNCNFYYCEIIEPNSTVRNSAI